VEESDVFRGYGVEVDLIEYDNFLKVKETLTRVGMLGDGENILNQPCFLLHKKGRYAIMHYNELLNLDGIQTEITEDDLGVRNTIACLLEQWGLVVVMDADDVLFPRASLNQMKIVPFRYKSEYILNPLYDIGKKA